MQPTSLASSPGTRIHKATSPSTNNFVSTRIVAIGRAKEDIGCGPAMPNAANRVPNGGAIAQGDMPVRSSADRHSRDRGDRRLVEWIGGVSALSPTRVPGHAVRTYSGRLS